MTPPDDRDLAALRVAYNVAITAHAECAKALTEVLMRGGEMPAALVEAEAMTRRQREEARRRLHAAMARALGPPPESPAPSKPTR
jgi:hypothetical protein